ncbi:MAG: hypothetical protein QNI94_10560 [Kiloniellales bacterium]|nr:hypothetical protein [Kiloniellales bacterium]
MAPRRAGPDLSRPEAKPAMLLEPEAGPTLASLRQGLPLADIE